MNPEKLRAFFNGAKVIVPVTQLYLRKRVEDTLEKVAMGAIITITRRGIPIAVMQSPKDTSNGQ